MMKLGFYLTWILTYTSIFNTGLAVYQQDYSLSNSNKLCVFPRSTTTIAQPYYALAKNTNPLTAISENVAPGNIPLSLSPSQAVTSPGVITSPSQFLTVSSNTAGPFNFKYLNNNNNDYATRIQTNDVNSNVVTPLNFKLNDNYKSNMKKKNNEINVLTDYVTPRRPKQTTPKFACLAGYDKEIFDIIKDIETTAGNEIEVHFYILHRCKFNYLGTHTTDVKSLQEKLAKYHHYICLDKKYVESYDVDKDCWYINKLILLPSFDQDLGVLSSNINVNKFQNICEAPNTGGCKPLVLRVEEKINKKDSKDINRILEREKTTEIRLTDLKKNQNILSYTMKEETDSSTIGKTNTVEYNVYKPKVQNNIYYLPLRSDTKTAGTPEYDSSKYSLPETKNKLFNVNMPYLRESVLSPEHLYPGNNGFQKNTQKYSIGKIHTENPICNDNTKPEIIEVNPLTSNILKQTTNGNTVMNSANKDSNSNLFSLYDSGNSIRPTFKLPNTFDSIMHDRSHNTNSLEYLSEPKPNLPKQQTKNNMFNNAENTHVNFDNYQETQGFETNTPVFLPNNHNIYYSKDHAPLKASSELPNGFQGNNKNYGTYILPEHLQLPSHVPVSDNNSFYSKVLTKPETYENLIGNNNVLDRQSSLNEINVPIQTPKLTATEINSGASALNSLDLSPKYATELNIPFENDHTLKSNSDSYFYANNPEHVNGFSKVTKGKTRDPKTSNGIFSYDNQAQVPCGASYKMLTPICNTISMFPKLAYPSKKIIEMAIKPTQEYLQYTTTKPPEAFIQNNYENFNSFGTPKSNIFSPNLQTTDKTNQETDKGYFTNLKNNIPEIASTVRLPEAIAPKYIEKTLYPCNLERKSLLSLPSYTSNSKKSLPQIFYFNKLKDKRLPLEKLITNLNTPNINKNKLIFNNDAMQNTKYKITPTIVNPINENVNIMQKVINEKAGNLLPYNILSNYDEPIDHYTTENPRTWVNYNIRPDCIDTAWQTNKKLPGSTIKFVNLSRNPNNKKTPFYCTLEMKLQPRNNMKYLGPNPTIDYSNVETDENYATKMFTERPTQSIIDKTPVNEILSKEYLLDAKPLIQKPIMYDLKQYPDKTVSPYSSDTIPNTFKSTDKPITATIFNKIAKLNVHQNPCYKKFYSKNLPKQKNSLNTNYVSAFQTIPRETGTLLTPQFSNVFVNNEPCFTTEETSPSKFGSFDTNLKDKSVENDVTTTQDLDMANLVQQNPQYTSSNGLLQMLEPKGAPINKNKDSVEFTASTPNTFTSILSNDGLLPSKEMSAFEMVTPNHKPALYYTLQQQIPITTGKLENDANMKPVEIIPSFETEKYQIKRIAPTLKTHTSKPVAMYSYWNANKNYLNNNVLNKIGNDKIYLSSAQPIIPIKKKELITTKGRPPTLDVFTSSSSNIIKPVNILPCNLINMDTPFASINTSPGKKTVQPTNPSKAVVFYSNEISDSEADVYIPENLSPKPKTKLNTYKTYAYQTPNFRQSAYNPVKIFPSYTKTLPEKFTSCPNVKIQDYSVTPISNIGLFTSPNYETVNKIETLSNDAVTPEAITTILSVSSTKPKHNADSQRMLPLSSDRKNVLSTFEETKRPPTIALNLKSPNIPGVFLSNVSPYYGASLSEKTSRPCTLTRTLPLPSSQSQSLPVFSSSVKLGNPINSLDNLHTNIDLANTKAFYSNNIPLSHFVSTNEIPLSSKSVAFQRPTEKNNPIIWINDNKNQPLFSLTNNKNSEFADTKMLESNYLKNMSKDKLQPLAGIARLQPICDDKYSLDQLTLSPTELENNNYDKLTGHKSTPYYKLNKNDLKPSLFDFGLNQKYATNYITNTEVPEKSNQFKTKSNIYLSADELQRLNIPPNQFTPNMKKFIQTKINTYTATKPYYTFWSQKKPDILQVKPEILQDYKENVESISPVKDDEAKYVTIPDIKLPTDIKLIPETINNAKLIYEGVVPTDKKTSMSCNTIFENPTSVSSNRQNYQYYLPYSNIPPQYANIAQPKNIYNSNIGITPLSPNNDIKQNVIMTNTKQKKQPVNFDNRNILTYSNPEPLPYESATENIDKAEADSSVLNVENVIPEPLSYTITRTKVFKPNKVEITNNSNKVIPKAIQIIDGTLIPDNSISNEHKLKYDINDVFTEPNPQSNLYKHKQNQYITITDELKGKIQSYEPKTFLGENIDTSDVKETAQNVETDTFIASPKYVPISMPYNDKYKPFFTKTINELIQPIKETPYKKFQNIIGDVGVIKNGDPMHIKYENYNKDTIGVFPINAQILPMKIQDAPTINNLKSSKIYMPQVIPLQNHVSEENSNPSLIESMPNINTYYANYKNNYKTLPTIFPKKDESSYLVNYNKNLCNTNDFIPLNVKMYNGVPLVASNSQIYSPIEAPISTSINYENFNPLTYKDDSLHEINNANVLKAEEIPIASENLSIESVAPAVPKYNNDKQSITPNLVIYEYAPKLKNSVIYNTFIPNKYTINPMKAVPSIFDAPNDLKEAKVEQYQSYIVNPDSPSDISEHFTSNTEPRSEIKVEHTSMPGSKSMLNFVYPKSSYGPVIFKPYIEVYPKSSLQNSFLGPILTAKNTRLQNSYEPMTNSISNNLAYPAMALMPQHMWNPGYTTSSKPMWNGNKDNVFTVPHTPVDKQKESIAYIPNVSEYKTLNKNPNILKFVDEPKQETYFCTEPTSENSKSTAEIDTNNDIKNTLYDENYEINDPQAYPEIQYIPNNFNKKVSLADTNNMKVCNTTLDEIQNCIVNTIQKSPILKEKLYNANENIELPMKNIVFTKVINDNSNELKLIDHGIALKGFKVKVKVLKPRIVFDTNEVEITNFVPVVRANERRDQDFIQNIVKNVISKSYKNPIVMKERIFERDPSVILKEFEDVDDKAFIWPAVYSNNEYYCP